MRTILTIIQKVKKSTWMEVNKVDKGKFNTSYLNIVVQETYQYDVREGVQST